MLSQHDQRALAEIEAELRASDPRLARKLHGAPAHTPTTPRRPAARRPARLAWLAMGVILLATAFAVHSADLAFLAVGVILADLSVRLTTRVAVKLRRRGGTPR